MSDTAIATTKKKGVSVNCLGHFSLIQLCFWLDFVLMFWELSKNNHPITTFDLLVFLLILTLQVAMLSNLFDLTTSLCLLIMIAHCDVSCEKENG